MTKLTIIGAGSAVFTKNIFTDLMFIDDFKKMNINIILSPACSSFDQFNNFEDRGKEFKQLVSEKIKISD